MHNFHILKYILEIELFKCDFWVKLCACFREFLTCMVKTFFRIVTFFSVKPSKSLIVRVILTL